MDRPDMVDENASVAAIYDYLTGPGLKGKTETLPLVMAVDEPKGKQKSLRR